jgi:hypothetical protein
MTAEIIQFIPRPRHNRETDFPTIAFKSIPHAPDTLQQQAIEIMNVHIIPHDAAIYESSLGFISEKDPA